MPPTNLKSISQEARIQLAIQALDLGQIYGLRNAARIYNVPRSSLKTRRDGTTLRRDCTPNSMKLTVSEEEAIKKYILELDSRGFAPPLNAVREMANKLLAERGSGSIGINWPHTFVKRTPGIQTKYNRKLDYQHYRQEEPVIIQGWFDLVRNMKAKYGIQDEDTYNFDESGFQMGIITQQKVVTGSERRNRPKALQPGNRK